MCTHKSHSWENYACALRENAGTEIQIVYSTNLQVEDLLQIFFFLGRYSYVHTVNRTVGKQMKTARSLNLSQNVRSGVNLTLVTEIIQTWMISLIFS